MKNILGKIVEHKKLVILLLVVACGAAYYFYGKSKSSQTQTSRPEFATVKKADLAVSVDGSGQVYAKSQVDLKPQVAGDGLDVMRVEVKNDQEVKKGQLIAVLDYSDAQKSVRNAQIDLESAGFKYDQVKDQYEDDQATKEDKKIQKLSVQQKQNSLSDAREKVGDYYIRAPFDGIVTGLGVEVGSSVSRTDILASVITKEMYAKVSLNEVDAVSVKVGDEAKLTFDAIDGLDIEGKVTKIDTIGTITQGVVYYEAEISFDKTDERLKPSMSVSAKITTESKSQVLTVPSAAVKSGKDGEYVQVQAERQKPTDQSDQAGEQTTNLINKNVKTGITDGISVEIVSGLSEGERVLIKSVSSASTSSSNMQNSQRNSFRIPGMGGGHVD